MRIFVTEIMALDVKTGEMCKWSGDDIEAPSFELAQQWAYENKGYLKVVGEKGVEISFKENSFEPDFEKIIDYRNNKLN